MIFDLRGSSGAGKSYVGHALLERYGRDDEIILEPGNPFNKNKKKPKVGGYRLPGGLVVLGRYESTCGGLEIGLTGVQTGEYIEQAARLYDHVFVEGLFLSLVYGRYLELQQKLIDEGYEYVTGFLNTPMDVCHERVLERNGGKKINVDATIIKNWTRIHKNIRPAFLEAGLPAPYVP